MTKEYRAGPPRTFSPENLVRGRHYKYVYNCFGDREEDTGRFLRPEFDNELRKLWLWFRHYDGPKSRRTYDSPVECKDIITIMEQDD